MEKDSDHLLSELAVDGGMSNSDLCMQVRPAPISLPIHDLELTMKPDSSQHYRDPS